MSIGGGSCVAVSELSSIRHDTVAFETEIPASSPGCLQMAAMVTQDILVMVFPGRVDLLCPGPVVVAAGIGCYPSFVSDGHSFTNDPGESGSAIGI